MTTQRRETAPRCTECNSPRVDAGGTCLNSRCGSVPCIYQGGPERCYHHKCKIATVADPRVRRRLEINGEIYAHLLTNWGRFERATPRGSAARNRLARLIRAIRREGSLRLDVAVPTILWGAAAVGG